MRPLVLLVRLSLPNVEPPTVRSATRCRRVP